MTEVCDHGTACRRDVGRRVIYAGCMRYPDGGGLSARGRVRREMVRLQAAQMFEHDVEAGAGGPAVTGQHQVGVSVAALLGGRWPGRAGLARAGRAGVPGDWHAAGPAAGGSWSGARPRGAGMRTSAGRWPGVTTLIGRLFHVALQPAGHVRTCCTVIGFSSAGALSTGPPSATRRRSPAWKTGDLGRRCEASGGDRSVDLLRGRRPARPCRLTRARTWAPCGHTPVITVSGSRSGRISVAGLVCLRPGARGHLLYQSGSTGATRASAAACLKPITPA